MIVCEFHDQAREADGVDCEVRDEQGRPLADQRKPNDSQNLQSRGGESVSVC